MRALETSWIDYSAGVRSANAHQGSFVRGPAVCFASCMHEPLTGELIAGLKAAGVRFIAWLPDTWLGGVGQAAATDSSFTTVQVTNEAEGLAVCGGAWLAGQRPALLMENTGLLVALHNVEYVCAYYGIPVLMIMSYRGALGDGLWWFSGVGERLEPALRLWQIHTEVVAKPDRLRASVDDAVRSMENSKRPAALLIPKGLVSKSVVS
jgi:sulfopyruvate decarboxylase subunit alpha